MKHLKFIAAVVVLNYLIALLFSFVSHWFFDDTLVNNTIVWDSVAEQLIVGILAAPLLETLLFQVAAYKFCLYVMDQTVLPERTKNIIFILSSSVFFAAMHHYNWLYC